MYVLDVEWEKLWNYIKKKLRESGVFVHEDHIFREAVRIHSSAWRQIPNHFKHADHLIQQAIRCPPNPIDKKHFSLKAFIELRHDV